MPSGSIVIKASTAQRLIPVEDATVFIIQRSENGKDNMLASRSTGGSGQTMPVAVETPEKNLSTRQGEEKPFASVDIRIEHPLYYTHYITDAQIFADTESVQNVTLIPLAIPTENITDRVIITPQNL